MAIGKDKVPLQISFPKEEAEHLEVMKDAFNKEGIKVTKSDILVKAFKEYKKSILLMGAIAEGGKEDA